MGYADYDAIGLAELVRSGDASPLELLEEAVHRVDQVNPELNAVTMMRSDAARAEIERGLPEGPFSGVPFLVKDLNTHMAGGPLTNGWTEMVGYVSDRDSAIVERYRQAGLVLFGRTTSPELGLLPHTYSDLFGHTANPWNLERSPGGSSGGAAAVVAAGVVPVAHATDGGGSIRIPAACCGLVGLKPARGRVPMGPHVGEGWGGMSVGHVVSRTVRDSAAFLDVAAGPDPGAPYWAPPPVRPFLDEVGRDPGSLRIGLCTTSWLGVPVDDEARTAAEATARTLEELGHRVEPITLDLSGFDLARIPIVIIGTNVAAVVEDRARELGRPAEELRVGPMLGAQAEIGRATPATEYVRTLREMHQVGRAVAEQLSGVDVLCTPAMAGPPALLTELSGDPSDGRFMDHLFRCIAFTSLFNATGHPAVSLPVAQAVDGLPLGVQLVGPPAGEAVLVALASQLEVALPWSGRRPALFVG